MKSLVKSLVTPFLSEADIPKSNKIVGVFGGGFQPPTRGHFEVVKKALEMYPELNQLNVYVGTGGGRSDITQEQSVAIWNIYKDYLPSKVNIIPSNNPRESIYDLRRSNPTTPIKWFIGSREGKEEDEKDYQKALSTIGPTRPNLELVNIVTPNSGVSGTKARAVLDNKEEFFKYLPNIKDTDKEQIYSILKPVKEGEEIINWVSEEETPSSSNDFFEPLQNQDLDLNTSSESSRVDYYKDHIQNVVPSDFKVDKHKDKIVVSNITKKGLEHNKEFRDKLISLTLSMMDNGLNLEPLPDIIFIEDDKKNADNILGRTAYYDPNTSCITLYTHSRHPKDILRSYAHEMIHHMQNLEGRIQGIKGHNINEDEYLQELELEAYSKGNMCFRSWENSLNESKFQTEYKQYAVNELFEKDLPNIKQISPNEYKVGNGDDIEALYYFRLEIPEKKAWSVHWAFTDNNKNTSPEAWKQVTASSFKVLKNFLDYHNPKSLHISGNTNTKTKIYKTYSEKLENMFSDRYKVDNSDEDKIVMRSIEEVMQSSIKKRIETLNETYDQALNYWQNGNINSNSKSESWSAIKQKVKREVLQSLYDI